MKSAKKAVKKAAAARRKAAVKKTARVARKAAARENDGLLVEVQNLGPVTRAELRLKNLTVFAGPNKTGKTFVSKTLYSMFGALNANHLMVEFNQWAGRLRENLRHLTADSMFASSSPPSVAELVEAVNRMELVAKKCSAEAGDSVANPEQGYPALKEAAERVSNACNRLGPALRNWANQDGMGSSASEFRGEAGRLHFSIESNVDFLRDLGKMTAGDIAIYGFRRQAFQNFLSNFQVHNISDLKSGGNEASVHINGEHVLGIGNYGGTLVGIVVGDFPVSMPPQMRRWSNLFFLEFPALWRLKGILESVMLESRNGRTRSDVPEYFRVLLAELPKEYSGEMPFPEIHRRLTEEVIGGKIVRTDLGELRFAESGGGVYPLSRTASGVVNPGILALLIERKLVDKRTFLFIDEPESNLHPEWQVKMAETLYELARAGVNIVLATHSIDILKRLEIYAKEDPDAEKFMAVNHFALTDKGAVVKDNGESLESKISAVMKELSSPFFDLYVRGL